MDISSITAAKVRCVARLLAAMDQGKETAPLIETRLILDRQIELIDRVILEIEQEGENQMERTENEKLAEHFVDGANYLRLWKSDADLRTEFEQDFAAFCHFKVAEAQGLVRILQGQTKI